MTDQNKKPAEKQHPSPRDKQVRGYPTKTAEVPDPDKFKDDGPADRKWGWRT